MNGMDADDERDVRVLDFIFQDEWENLHIPLKIRAHSRIFAVNLFFPE
jgi:hypothetical protein